MWSPHIDNNINKLLSSNSIYIWYSAERPESDGGCDHWLICGASKTPHAGKRYEISWIFSCCVPLNGTLKFQWNLSCPPQAKKSLSHTQESSQGPQSASNLTGPIGDLKFDKGVFDGARATSGKIWHTGGPWIRTDLRSNGNSQQSMRTGTVK